MPVWVVPADPEAVDEVLFQMCSSQLKLLQLYTDIQQLHCTREATTDSHTEPVSTTNTTGCKAV